MTWHLWVAAAQDLPHALGAELLATAQAAFVHAFELTAAICAVTAAATALAAVVLLRRIRSGLEAVSDGSGATANPSTTVCAA